MVAEALKQHRNMYHSKLIYFSMLIWPAIGYFAAWYMFRPFTDSPALLQRLQAAAGTDQVALFVLLGYLGYTFFFSLVQSAWIFSFERFAGTLELVFLSPASRFGLMLGNALASLVESVWLFVVFTTACFTFLGEVRIAHPLMVPLALAVLVVSAAAWGTFLNCFFVFSRDSGFLYSVVQEPMSFFSGSRLPTATLPLWARYAGYLFPLTFALSFARRALLQGQTFGELLPLLGLILAVSAGLFALSLAVLAAGERHARRAGNLALF